MQKRLRKYFKNKYFLIKIVLLCSLFLTKINVSAQQTMDTIFIGESLFLDSVVIKAAKIGFDVQDFILRMQRDESFYKAFRNLRTMTYYADNQLFMFNKKQKEKAVLKSRIHQKSDGKCRTMDVVEEIITGDLLDDSGAYNYYTAKLLDKLFFTHGKICDSEKDTKEMSDKGNPKINQHVNELKKLIFKPGEPTDVPFIGAKTAIFSPEMQPYYDYSVTSKVFNNKFDCYVFSAAVKSEFLTKNTQKTVIKYLETYFDKLSKQVVGRRYQLRYGGFWFDFDVKMEIELTKIGDKYVPQNIHYDGNWNVPLQKREIAKFDISFFDFENNK